MSNAITLQAERRNIHGKQVKQLRRDGIIPGVVYGPNAENPVSVQIDWVTLRPILREAGGTGLIDLTVDGETYSVLIRSVQRHAIRRDVTHIDFFAVDTTHPIRITVPIVVPNLEAISKRLQAKLFQPVNRIEIECLPGDIPKQITVDGTVLTTAGQNVLVKDLPVSDKVTLLADEDLAVIRSISLSLLEFEQEEEEDLEGEMDTSMEPELVGGDRDDEEEF